MFSNYIFGTTGISNYRGKEASDKKSIGEMFSLESQGNKVSEY